jgi:hypothetical protein
VRSVGAVWLMQNRRCRDHSSQNPLRPFIPEGAQVDRSRFQTPRVVVGEAEHAVAAIAKKGAHLAGCMGVVDAQRRVGLRLADRAQAALVQQHATILFLGNPVDGFESFLSSAPAFTRALPLAIGRIF